MSNCQYQNNQFDQKQLEQFRQYLHNIKDDWNYILPTQLYKQLQSNPTKYYLLDVRHPKDYNKQHIPGAKNIFWLELFKNCHINQLPRKQTIILICYVGHTSSQVLTLLKLLGFKVVSLKFGMGLSPTVGVPVAGWLDYGFPTISKKTNSKK